MSNYDYGFVKLPRALLSDKSFIKAPLSYKWVLITIFQHMAWKPEPMDDHGVSISVEIGQFLCTERRLAELAGVTKNEVHRAIKRFSKNNYVNQTIPYKKTLYTISKEYILEYEPRSEPRSEPNFLERKLEKVNQEVNQEVNQGRTINKESKEIKESKQEKKDAAAFVDFSSIEKLCIECNFPFDQTFLKKFLKKHSLEYIKAQLGEYYKRFKLAKKPIPGNPRGWFTDAMKENYANYKNKDANEKVAI